VKEENGD